MRFATPSWQAAAGRRTAAARHPYPGNEGASRFGAAAPFVSIGRGAAPSGPLTSNGAVVVSRRWRGGSSLCASRLRLGKPPQGVGRRRPPARSLRLGERAIPTLGENEGASRFAFVSIGRGAAPSGPLTSNGAVVVSRRWGLGSLSVPCGCTKKEGLLPAPR